jgi:6-O-methylguanine DNA methyltransferase, DNA binding domain
MKKSTLAINPWNLKLNVKKLSKRVVLDKDFAGIKAGSTLYVGTPQLIDEYIKKIPYGEVRTIIRLRNELARRNKCDATCPVSTAIFLRISAQAAIEKMKAGVPLNELSPFWRIIDAGSTIAKKIDVDSEWINHQRELEAAAVKK